MDIKNVAKLSVRYNGKTVGYLAEMKNGKIAFQYSDEWQKNGFSVSPFSLPLTDAVYINDKQNFGGLYGVFWDSFPDGWGELLVRRKLKALGVNFDALSPLQKLSIISKNGLGGLEYVPNQALQVEVCDYDLDELAKVSTEVLNDATDIDLDAVFNLGGSSGGARPKAHIRYDNEEWIVKFPCLIDPQNIGEKEFIANELAKKCGIKVNEYKLFASKINSGYFGAKRFDRYADRKIHTISLCALLETTHRIPNLDYGHLFQVIQKICPDKNDLYEAFKRMCFNVHYKNKDDHGKNFAFLYDENLRGYRLSPAYDITSTPNKLEHEMTINGSPNPTDDDMLELAKDFDLSINTCREIIDKIKKILH